jgi:hypothetical protein
MFKSIVNHDIAADIAAVALATYEAGAPLLLTFNVRDFHAVSRRGSKCSNPDVYN